MSSKNKKFQNQNTTNNTQNTPAEELNATSNVPVEETPVVEETPAVEEAPVVEETPVTAPTEETSSSEESQDETAEGETTPPQEDIDNPESLEDGTKETPEVTQEEPIIPDAAPEITPEEEAPVVEETPAVENEELVRAYSRFHGLGIHLNHGMKAKGYAGAYICNVADAFSTLKSLKPSNRAEVSSYLKDFCIAYKQRVLEGKITRDNYLTDADTIKTVSRAQLGMFVGMVYEVCKNSVLRADIRAGNRTLDSYFSNYLISANKQKVIELMTAILAEV